MTLDNIVERVKSISTEIDTKHIILPRSIKFELAGICNHQCIYCGVPHTKPACIFMKPEIFKLGVAEAYKWQIKELGLFHMGEGTLHPEILDFVDYTKREYYDYFNMFITTNGTKLEVLKGLVKAGIKSIKFSLNGYSRETHYKATRVDDFDTIINNLKELISFRDVINSPTEISASSIYYNNKEQDAFVEEMAKFTDNFYYTEIYNHAGKIPTKFIKLTDNIRIIPRLCDKPCFGLFNLAHIKVDGTLNLCRFGLDHEFDIGHIIDGFEKCWFSPRAMEIREQHMKDQIETCNECLGLKRNAQVSDE